MHRGMKRVFDPLYGVITFTDQEYAIITSPELQRLRYVRMCNINSLLVTGASEISRFEHIIGVLKLAQEWTTQNANILSRREQNEICSAALLHDFQTGPFGHSLQYVFEDNESEEEFVHEDIEHGMDASFHQKTDANKSFSGRPFNCKNLLGESWPNVASMIRGEGKYGKIISGSIDLDNIDNVIRLGYHVGVANAKDADVAINLARDIFPKGNTLEISEKSVPLIERWQEIRNHLYELLLLDWAEFSAKAMLTRALELAVDFDLLGTDSWLRTDLELYDHLEKSSVGDPQEVGDLVKRIRCGELFEPVQLYKSSQTSLYDKFSNKDSKRAFERELILEIREKLKISTNIIIHPILDKKKTQRSVEVVFRGSKERQKIGIDSDQLLIGVFLSKPILSYEKASALNIVVEKFLKRYGLSDIQPLEDPMGTQNNLQMALL